VSAPAFFGTQGWTLFKRKPISLNWPWPKLNELTFVAYKDKPILMSLIMRGSGAEFYTPPTGFCRKDPVIQSVAKSASSPFA
jgi:hypothetical protein